MIDFTERHNPLDGVGSGSEADLLTAVVDARLVLEAIQSGIAPEIDDFNSALAGLEAAQISLERYVRESA